MEPTVGRKVWFYPAEGESIMSREGQPLDATIAAVNEDGTINIGLRDCEGRDVGGRQNVELYSPGEDISPEAVDNGYCTWMPYQIKAAAESESQT